MKKFNITGLCISEQNYMVDIGDKMDKILKMIEDDEYFTINRARQYGKTTTFSQIYNKLKDKYIVLSTSFEGIGDTLFLREKDFCKKIFKIFAMEIKYETPEIAEKLENAGKNLNTLDEVSDSITKFIRNVDKEVILIIDEVDKNSNNQLFLSFLGMLRNKFLLRKGRKDITFKSVILASVYDIKNLKLKINSDGKETYNSPWNIAADFKVDLSFNPQEISTMLSAYQKDHNLNMDIIGLSYEIYKYTSGYPFLVSKICKTLDEELNKDWTIKGIESAVNQILKEKNTLFDDIAKNIENNHELYDLVWKILLTDESIPYSNTDPVISLGSILGFFKTSAESVEMHNIIFSQLLYNHLVVAKTRKGEKIANSRGQFFKGKHLNMEIVMNKFQEIMYEEYRDKDTKFIEREGRLLFLCFLKPIINGKGFYYVEPQTRMDNRMDIVITYGSEQFIVELKIWHGENYENEALEQLTGYLESKRENKGYLISFSFNKNKEYSKEWKKFKDKNIYAIVV